NRMGFNNDGMEIIAKRIQQTKPNNFLVGVNIGKNKDTPNEFALNDYQKCFLTFQDLADYITVNVSSPNTQGLRDLQSEEPLQQLLDGIQKLNQQRTRPVPLFVKIAPDLSISELEAIVSVTKKAGFQGIIATNTTINRDNLKSNPKWVESLGPGGISGYPLAKPANECMKQLKQLAGTELILIGVGGIMTTNDAIERIESGADLIQIYTGLVYNGPTLPTEIVQALSLIQQAIR
ncbi:MAG: quinone-dependent dihydroorotate dehydrogenase, partial [Bacteroidia bacterium]|nr:quinone-dependent dihydroorotate dehydrogenase [Bacteroidia bacterium]